MVVLSIKIQFMTAMIKIHTIVYQADMHKQDINHYLPYSQQGRGGFIKTLIWL